MLLSLIFGLALGAASAVFIVQNVTVVTITFLHWQFEGSLAVLLLLTIVVGVVITLLVLLPAFIRDTFHLSAIEKENKKLEEDLAKTKQALAEASARPYGSPPVRAEAA